MTKRWGPNLRSEAVRTKRAEAKSERRAGREQAWESDWMCTDDEVTLVEIGGRKVLMFTVEAEGFAEDQREYGEAIVDVDERGFGRWIPQRDLLET